MTTQQLELTAVVHKEEDGTYWAEVTELPGCFASGHSLDELKEALSEAIPMCLPDVEAGAEAPPVSLAALRMIVSAS